MIAYPKYSELQNGKRNKGGQLLRYKDVIKRHLKTTNVNLSSWETMAQVKPDWRIVVNNCSKSVDEQKRMRYYNAKQKRQNFNL